MNRLWLTVVLLSMLLPGRAGAVDLKNVRMCYGVMGATRHSKQVQQGDYLYLTFDIDGLAVEAKTRRASYVTTIELLDSKQTVLSKQMTPVDATLQLGGGRMPGEAFLLMGARQPLGKHTIRVSVRDQQGKDLKSFDYDFEVVPASFAMISITAPAIGFPGRHYVVGFALANMTFNGMAVANVDTTLRILDERGMPVVPAAKLPLPEGINPAGNFAPFSYPVYVNRPGRYTMEIVAIDNNAKQNQKLELRYPFTILDVSSFTGK
jgi:hypothetical protein